MWICQLKDREKFKVLLFQKRIFEEDPSSYPEIWESSEAPGKYWWTFYIPFQCKKQVKNNNFIVYSKQDGRLKEILTETKFHKKYEMI